MNARPPIRLLDGVRVVALAGERASFCAELLAGLGVDVVYSKVDDEADVDRLHVLLRDRDALVEGEPPGRLEQLGLRFGDPQAIDSRVVRISLTPFGQTGPRHHFVSCDWVQLAYGGLLAVCGSAAGPPLPMPGSPSERAAALHGAIGLLLALAQRRADGRGRWVDVSAQEAVASMLDHVLVRYVHEGAVAKRQGDLSWNRLAFVVPCRNGFLQLHVGTQWDELVEWIDSEGMAADLKDDAWHHEQYRFENVGHLIDVLSRWSAGYDVDQLFHAAQLRRFPWTPVRSPEDAGDGEQLRARAFVLDDGDARASVRANAPYFVRSLSSGGEAAGGGQQRANDREVRALRETGATSARGARAPQASNGGAVLDGIRVLDFGWVLSAPYATRLLGDFGAEVIKVQSAKTARGAESPTGAWFATWNRNKRGLSIDMSRPGAAELVLDLVRISDVLVENFAPRVLPNWGLDDARLAQANPALVAVHLSAMGRTGPWKDYVGFGPAFHALSGVTHAMRDATGRPLGPGVAWADHVFGLYAALATLAALDARARGGGGCSIDVSGHESMCAFAQSRVPPRSPAPSPAGCFPCNGNDRWCVVCVPDDAAWRALCEATGHREWLRDPCFADAAARDANRASIESKLAQWTATRSVDEVVGRMQRAGVAAGAVQDAADLIADPHLAARDFFVPLAHPSIGAYVGERSPIVFAGDDEATSRTRRRAAPMPGEANEYVLGELLGYDRSRIDRLRRDGVLG